MAGGPLGGTVCFAGGKRAQDVTRLTLKLVVDETSTRQVLVNGQPTWQPHTDHRDVVPATVVGGPFQSIPGQTSNFPFQLAIPPGVPNSTPQRVKYRLIASADIDNAVDPGAHVEVHVTGGASPAMAPGAPGAMPQSGYAGMPQPGYPGANPQPGYAGMHQFGQTPTAAIALGTHVLAQWQDGHWHPAIVTAHREGMIGVDWTDPRLGASSWVAPHQLQPAQAQPAAGYAPPPPATAHPAPSAAPMGGKFAAAAPHDSYVKGAAHDPYAKGAAHDPYAKGAAHDPYAKSAAHDPYAKGAAHDPYAKGAAHDAYAKGAAHDPYAKGAPASHLPVGAAVTAQHANGQWHPARVAAHQNGLVGVDWDDPRLGASTWVQPQQVVPR
jgi:hypothetical protein